MVTQPKKAPSLENRVDALREHLKQINELPWMQRAGALTGLAADMLELLADMAAQIDGGK